jgi:hypothetical protein
MLAVARAGSYAVGAGKKTFEAQGEQGFGPCAIGRRHARLRGMDRMAWI